MSIHGKDSMHMPRIRKFTCDACHDTECECFTEGDVPPTRCCMQYIPKWKEYRGNAEAGE